MVFVLKHVAEVLFILESDLAPEIFQPLLELKHAVFLLGFYFLPPFTDFSPEVWILELAMFKSEGLSLRHA